MRRAVSTSGPHDRALARPAVISTHNENPDYQRSYRLRTSYSLEPGDWQRMSDEQGGVCAICERRPPEGHDDVPDRLLAAAAYLIQHQAAIAARSSIV